MPEIITRERLAALAREYLRLGINAPEAVLPRLREQAARELATAVLAWDEQERAALLAGQVAAKDRAEQAIARLTGDAAVRS